MAKMLSVVLYNIVMLLTKEKARWVIKTTITNLPDKTLTHLSQVAVDNPGWLFHAISAVKGVGNKKALIVMGNLFGPCPIAPFNPLSE